MIHVHIDKTYSNIIKSALLRKPAATVVKEYSPLHNVDLTIVVADNEYLRQLNLQFLNVDKPTDVLSFPSDEIDPDSGRPYLGDVAISYPKAAEQAVAAGHPVESELQLLVVHGVLHLLGYDHTTPARKADMWRIQAHVLDQLSVQILKLPEE